LPQRPEHGAHVPSPADRQETRHVFEAKPGGTERSSETDDLAEESGSLASQSSTLASHGVVLARPAGHEYVNWFELGCPNLRDISVPPHIRPVLRQHSITCRIVLDLPGNLTASSLESDVDAADAREDATNRQH